MLPATLPRPITPSFWGYLQPSVQRPRQEWPVRNLRRRQAHQDFCTGTIAVAVAVAGISELSRHPRGCCVRLGPHERHSYLHAP
jgi:hypothetical protein